MSPVTNIDPAVFSAHVDHIDTPTPSRRVTTGSIHEPDARLPFDACQPDEGSNNQILGLTSLVGVRRLSDSISSSAGVRRSPQ
jgi:hypothetical protein